MVWTFFDAHQLGVRLNFDIDVKILVSDVDRNQFENKGFHVGDARVKKLTPASKICDQSGPII